ncbi:UDP-glucose 4-epimerase [Candidatus Desulfarcum epimagneticum]|uniref:UDP-glucose 4-epimerase n=1 Tax=uncultured Desulfobacteraceae bacterium TaxID=218296 RepID=A0A484HIL4_9BACT|nr:UDP-glucose 4-epimerase [uncultured Desulfobacteraceae bacterium]
MKKQRVLITGGAGYIGSHTNLELASAGYETVVLDNLVHGHRRLVRAGEFVPGDVGDAAALDRIFEQYDIAAALHFAAFAYAGESVKNPGKYYRNNVGNAIVLLDAMKKWGVDKFIFSSTCAVYGISRDPLISESHPRRPANPYGNTKLAVERMLEDYGAAHGIRHVIFRYFNAAGADPRGRLGELHDPETHLIPLALEAAADPDRRVRVFGTDYPTPDGSCVRDYIHVSDLARAHRLGMEYLMNGGKSEVFNLGAGRGFSVKEVLDHARRVTQRKIRTVDRPRRKGDPHHLAGSWKKARKTLGWRPELSDMETMITHAWNWRQGLETSQ